MSTIGKGGGAFATPTQQGRSLIGGPVGQGTDAERDAATRFVQKQGFAQGEEHELLQMLGLAGPDARPVQR